MPVEKNGKSPDLPQNPAEEKQAMQQHYEYYKNLADNGQLSDEDEEQWRLAQRRKASGLIE